MDVDIYGKNCPQIICMTNAWSKRLRNMYSRVWNKRTPLNKRSPLEYLTKRIIVAPFFTLYYEVRNKAVAPGKKSKN